SQDFREDHANSNQPMDSGNYYLTKNQQSTTIAKANASQWENVQKKFEEMELSNKCRLQEIEESARQKIEETAKRKDEEFDQMRKRKDEELEQMRIKAEELSIAKEKLERMKKNGSSWSTPNQHHSLIYPDSEAPQSSTAKEQWLRESSGQAMRSVKPYKIATYETWEPPDKVLQKTSENRSEETAVKTVATTPIAATEWKELAELKDKVIELTQ
ncbi:MAG: hypothetical protein GY820_34980, partial [Gammaproteobacteria bacterium]|nr:hypothetical protein [Gammaproteobacteria bacterium]